MTAEQILREALQHILQTAPADSILAWVASNALQEASRASGHVPDRRDHVIGMTTDDDRGRW